ncbi:rust resistance kinase Lr10-like [Mangifera indica]|uniref:rust resistance kinase Lr10-like n=1 Tax=Mangifera indica TaxID=29780 RepID=UPI001CFA48B7|nr:rust resistance kinase Lr10-like [Mangifera indica]
MSLVSFIIVSLLLPYSSIAKNTSVVNNDQNPYQFCQPTKCSENGPEIRFPFRLKTQPVSCGLEGFEMSCSNGKTMLHLPFSSGYFVEYISYWNGSIVIKAMNDTTCPIQSLVSLNLTSSKFSFLYSKFSMSTALLICEMNIRWDYSFVGPFDCKSDGGNFVYALTAFSDAEMAYQTPAVCHSYKSVNISSYFWYLYNQTEKIFIEWEVLDGCYHCEISGKYCGFDSTSNSTVCIKHKDGHGHGHLVKTEVSTATSVGGIVFFTLVILVIYKSRNSEMEKETQLKIEKFLQDYKILNPTRYTYRDLKKITGKFRHRLGQGGYGTVFRGKLANGIPVAVKMLQHSMGHGEEFINEVATIGRIHHFNIVRLLGFYSEGTRRALIYEFMPSGSLEKFIFSSIKNSTQRQLSWEKLQEIAIGIARGIEYLHQGCNQRILHFDIKPHNILLDHNFQPKISDFGLAKLCSKEQSVVSMTAARGTTGYIAPELFSRNFGEVSYKSDIFSYGMVLLEMVGCRKNIDISIENQSQICFPEWIYNKVSQGNELGLEIEVDRDGEIAKKLAIVGLWCIQWNPAMRPSMPIVLQMLEGDLQSLEIPPKPFVSSDEEIDA